MYKISLFLILILGCKNFDVQLAPKFNESKVVKLKVPIRQERASGYHEDEDISSLCEPKKMVYIKFSFNQPQEVWCE
ncbi:MAG TPA: hypothetical protein PK683_08780 [Leptospiraceae bacterium]|nr:hypothetical protein [Leptospiraceae bacterium]